MFGSGTKRQRNAWIAATLVCASFGAIFACTSYSSTPDGSDGGDLPPDDKDGSASCIAPKTVCGTACVETSKDDNNCGACGKKCDAGYMCTTGNCEIACSIGFSACKGAAPASDAGLSDAADAADAPTDATADATALDAAPVPTGPYCANFAVDSANCGSCGNLCTDGKVCTSGVCCRGDQMACGGACTTLSTDSNNCGTCGKVCPAATPFCSNSVCVERYVITGVKLDIAATDATRGWTECFKEQYDHGTALAQIQSACSKNNIMMACRRTGAPNLQLLAQGLRGDVFYNTGDTNTAKHEANGVAWYFSDNASFGFAPAGADVDRNSCDYIDSYTGSPQAGVAGGDKRMCSHTSSGSSQGGWRCGRDNSLGTGWERILYHAD